MNEACKNQIGYLPEERGLYKKLTAIDLILYLASLKGMAKVTAEKKAHVLLQQTGMLESKKKKNKEMSTGMGQIIQFIVTIIHDPKLIILDEPFSGLDPINTEIINFAPLWFASLLIAFPDSSIWVVLTIFPVTAPVQTKLRLGVSEIPFWQIITNIVVLGLSVIGGLFLSIKIFRMNMLMYGKKLSFTEIVHSLKNA